MSTRGRTCGWLRLEMKSILVEQAASNCCSTNGSSALFVLPKGQAKNLTGLASRFSMTSLERATSSRAAPTELDAFPGQL